MLNSLKKPLLLLCLAAVTTALSGCGSSNPATTSTTTEAFPSALSVASPTATGTTATSISASLSYDASLTSITSILEGTTLADCTFDPEDFLTESDDAACYGPEVDFLDHPNDGTTPTVNITFVGADGSLPTGDTGIWLEDEVGDTEACSAAQLNAQMSGVSTKAITALKMMATMICVANVNSVAIPENSTADLLASMNDAATENGTAITYSVANLIHSDATGDDVYTYEIEAIFTDADTNDHNLVVDATHIPGAADAYEGRFSYNFNGAVDIPGACSSANRETAGSVLYNLDADGVLALDARTAKFCDDDTSFFTEGLVDPSLAWKDDYNRFVANFDTATLDGEYTYGWQAGSLDSNSRNLNVTLTDTAGTLAGTAFFGYGDVVTTSDGSITGYICNWAGPGNDHTPDGDGTLLDLVQSQTISEDTDGTFLAGTSHITYAPTNSCDYNGLTTFQYDKNADGDLLDTDEETTDAVTNDLADLADYTAGFTLPTAPTNF